MKNQYDISAAVIPFSWHRVAMVGRFYYPTLKRQIILYPIVTVVLSILLYSLNGDEIVGAIISSLGVTFPIMFIYAPIALGENNRRITASLLPASARERFTFLALYFMVFIPAVVFGLNAAVHAICSTVCPDSAIQALLDRANTMTDGYSSSTNKWYYGILNWVPAVLCLWGMLYIRRSPIIKSIAMAFALNIVYSVVKGATMYHYITHHPEIAENRYSVADKSLEFVINFSNVSTILSFAAILVLLSMCYRAIRNYQA